METREIVLNLPAIDLKKIGKYASRLNRDHIDALLRPLVKLLKKGVKYSFTPVSEPRYVKNFKNLIEPSILSRLSKDDVTEIYFSFTNDLENVAKVAFLDENIFKTWEFALKQPEIGYNAINGILKRDLVVERPHTWIYDYFTEAIFSPLTVIDYGDAYYFNDNRLSLLKFSFYYKEREILARKLLGDKAAQAHIIQELPEREALNVENYEEHLPSDLTFLSGIALTDNFKTIETISVAKIKSIKKNIKSPGFSGEVSEYSLDRIELLINAYLYFYKNLLNNGNISNYADIGVFVKFIVGAYSSYIIGTRFGPFLPEFKGFTKTWAQFSNVEKMTGMIRTLLHPCAAGWMSTDNLKLRYLCSPPRQSNYYGCFHLFDRDDRQRHTLKFKDPEKPQSNFRLPIDWFYEVDFPFVIHWIRFLCGVGILELAIERNPEPGDLLEGVKYIRMTPLGRYAFGIDKSYQVKEVSAEEDLDIDDRNQIITVKTDSCPYTIFLEQVSRLIGGKRYHITVDSLMKGCTNKEMVEQRVKNFQSIVKPDKYPGFNSVIQGIKKRMNCVENRNGDYMMLQVTNNEPEFIKLLTTQKSIRENIVLAENGMIFMEKTYYPSFKLLCSNHGFIIK